MLRILAMQLVSLYWQIQVMSSYLTALFNCAPRNSQPQLLLREPPSELATWKNIPLMPQVEASCWVVLNFTSLVGHCRGGIVNIKWKIMEEKCTKNTIPAPAARSPLAGVGKGIDALPDGRAPTLSHSHSHSRGTEAAKTSQEVRLSLKLHGSDL